MFRITAATPKLQLEQVTVRHAVDTDDRALRELAALDSSPRLTGPALVAEADARVLAALPLGSGRPIADPFEPTAHLVALLELRKAQLRAGDGHGARRPRRLRDLLRTRVLDARA